MRWYNPSLGMFEWLEFPEEDEGAISLLNASPQAYPYLTVYRQWRGLGATVAASLIRAGEAARAVDEECWRGDEDP